MRMLDEKSINYTKKLILNGYALKGVTKEECLVYINNVADTKIVFNNSLVSKKAGECMDNLQVGKSKINENHLKNEVVKLVDLGCINENIAVSVFGKYLNRDKVLSSERQA
ncbi:MAG: hypothetical protein ACI4TX_00445 [Christensenellales bacterium]